MASGTSCGFNNFEAGPAGLRTYGANGNLIEDPYKGIDIDYNHLNLPKTMDFPGSDEITVTYDASGNKLSQTTLQGGVSTTRDYIGSLEYVDGVLESFYHAEAGMRLSY